MCQSTIYKAPRIIKQIANGKFFFSIFLIILNKVIKENTARSQILIVILTISCSTEFENLAFLSFYELKERNQKHNKQEHKYLATVPY